jgi:hypothetical protein
MRISDLHFFLLFFVIKKEKEEWKIFRWYQGRLEDKIICSGDFSSVARKGEF